jgi:hypothetical protein
MIRMEVGPRVRSWVAAEAAIYSAQEAMEEVVVIPTADALPSPLMMARPDNNCSQAVTERHTKWCNEYGFDPSYICQPVPLSCVA